MRLARRNGNFSGENVRISVAAADSLVRGAIFGGGISLGGVAISRLIWAFWLWAEIFVLPAISQARLSFFKGKLLDGSIQQEVYF